MEIVRIDAVTPARHSRAVWPTMSTVGDPYPYTPWAKVDAPGFKAGIKWYAAEMMSLEFWLYVVWMCCYVPVTLVTLVKYKLHRSDGAGV